MYAGVPIAIAGRGQPVVRATRPPCVAAATAFAMPKSATTAVPSLSSTFSGLMSRCTIPRRCAYASARATSRTTFTTSGDREGPVDHAVAQRRAAHERHDVVRHTIRSGTVAEHGNDVRLLQRRGELDLPRETLGAETRRQRSAREHLDHNVALEAQVAREEHARHASPTELTLERVRGAERDLELLLGEGLP